MNQVWQVYIQHGGTLQLIRMGRVLADDRRRAIDMARGGDWLVGSIDRPHPIDRARIASIRSGIPHYWVANPARGAPEVA